MDTMFVQDERLKKTNKRFRIDTRRNNTQGSDEMESVKAREQRDYMNANEKFVKLNETNRRIINQMISDLLTVQQSQHQ